MISRKTTKTIAEIYQARFRSRNPQNYIDKSQLYDFLYENNYDLWFLNATKKLPKRRRILKDFIMGLHTGETVSSKTPNWTWQQRSKLGQRILTDLAEDILLWSQPPNKYIPTGVKEIFPQLTSELEIDGYIFRDGKLYFSEATVLDTEGEIGILEKLIQDLELNNLEVIKHHLESSETHYIDNKWDDSISNSRKFLESILREIAAKHYFLEESKLIDSSVYKSPFQIRDYLTVEGLIEPKEKEAISKVYGLLSETGGHPYIAQKDQARLMRYLALSFAQFALLRFQGFLMEN